MDIVLDSQRHDSILAVVDFVLDLLIVIEGITKIES